MARDSLTAAVPASVARLPGRAVPRSFYSRDTLKVARDLLGYLLCRREPDGTWSVGRIVETEAYIGEEDPACHAAAGKTERNRILYGRPGIAYVYFTYGMHYCLNVVTEREGYPAAVLLRALRPEAGLRRMAARRGRDLPGALTSGPARLCEALAIGRDLNGAGFRGPDLHLREDGFRVRRVARGPRVGIRRGVDRPWRFWAVGDPHVSPGKPGPPPSPPRRPALPVDSEAARG